MINKLRYPEELIRLYLCEGDSNDDTYGELAAWQKEDDRIRIIHHNTGIPHHSHSTRPERMKSVSQNGNYGWDAIAKDGWGDYALMLESDLMYDAYLLTNLLKNKPPEANIFSPMIWIKVGNRLRFYDVWAYRINGKMFKGYSLAWYKSKYDHPFELDSVGSVVLFEMRLIKEGLRLGEKDCIVGMCNDARARGYKIFADPTIDVLHPTINGVS